MLADMTLSKAVRRHKERGPTVFKVVKHLETSMEIKI